MRATDSRRGQFCDTQCHASHRIAQRFSCTHLFRRLLDSNRAERFNASAHTVAPGSVVFGDTITVTGSRFSATGNALKISSGYISQTGTSDGTTLRFTISQSIGVCPPTSEACITLALILQPGTYNVNVVNANGSSNAGALTIAK